MRNLFKCLLTLVVIVSVAFSTNAEILYKIEGKSGKPSYIFGSHHLSPLTVVEDSGVMNYFNEVDQVIGELDLTMDQMTLATKLQPFMMAPADSTLSVLLAGEDMAALNEQFVKWAPMPGMQLQMLDALKPMAVTTMIAAGMSAQAMDGYDPTQQLDTYFFQEGQKQGKKIVGLETPEFQGEVLFNMTPLTVQAEALVEMLKNPDEAVAGSQKLAEAYKARDLETMYKLSEDQDEHPEFMELILDRRNADWLTKLPTLIEETPSFIVVGALHLAGPQGILEGLQKEGFTITPLY